MIITTKYNIGDRFWMPRVFDHMYSEIKIIDDKTYERRWVELVAKVKEKVITDITINVDLDGTHIKYHCSDPGTEWSTSIYTAEDFEFTEFGPALDFAQEWLKNNNTAYYGPSRNTNKI